jgi:spermidine synthase
MNRQAFILGFFATGGQVLLIRELISSLNGSEIFIGSALFGWLMWVALGALISGKLRAQASPAVLFAIGVVLLPLSIVAARLAPLRVTMVAGELIPVVTAALISVAVMFPVGITCGWLFPLITRRGNRQADSVVQVYLWEGLGAFVAGITITLLIGDTLSTLGMAVVIGAATLFVVFGLPEVFRVVRLGIWLVVLVVGVLAAVYVAPRLDVRLDAVKYSAYQIVESFDTHQGHQTLLSRAGSRILLTDNTVEAVYPDPETAENLLIPPLVYRPQAKRILFIGRAEFGVEQLAALLPGVSVTALDPREALSGPLDSLLGLSGGGAAHIDADPVKYVTRPGTADRFDIVVLAPLEPNNYQASRLLTTEFIRKARRLLADSGILYVPTNFDTDRYITIEESSVLSIIYATLRGSFRHVTLWPGNMTLFLAGSTPGLDLPYDSLTARLSRLSYSPQYINEDYLADRLNLPKRQRLLSAATSAERLNNVDGPILPYYQALYRARVDSVDGRVLTLLLTRPGGLIVAVVAAILLFIIVTVRFRRGRPFAFALFFAAGVVSLTLELLSFYVYQSSAGSIYSELAVLIGTFMLGLSVGAYITRRLMEPGGQYPPLILLLAATGVFLFTYNTVPENMLLAYHSLFLFTVALATGGLFAAATARYYWESPEGNPGAGYACELAGSSIGALLPMTVLLPMIGVEWLLVSAMVLLIFVLAGGALTSRRR